MSSSARAIGVSEAANHGFKAHEGSLLLAVDHSGTLRKHHRAGWWKLCFAVSSRCRCCSPPLLLLLTLLLLTLLTSRTLLLLSLLLTPTPLPQMGSGDDSRAESMRVPDVKDALNAGADPNAVCEHFRATVPPLVRAARNMHVKVRWWCWWWWWWCWRWCW